MKPVNDLVDLVVLALTQTTDGGRWFRLGPLPSSRSGSTSFMGVIGTFPAFVIASADSTCFMRGDLQLIRRESVRLMAQLARRRRSSASYIPSMSSLKRSSTCRRRTFNVGVSKPLSVVRSPSISSVARGFS